MKPPVIIWQKPEYKKFGRVKFAVLVSPTLILDQKETPEIKNFDHHQWMLPDGVPPPTPRMFMPCRWSGLKIQTIEYKDFQSA